MERERQHVVGTQTVNEYHGRPILFAGIPDRFSQKRQRVAANNIEASPDNPLVERERICPKPRDQIGTGGLGQWRRPDDDAARRRGKINDCGHD